MIHLSVHNYADVKFAKHHWISETTWSICYKAVHPLLKQHQREKHASGGGRLLFIGEVPVCPKRRSDSAVETRLPPRISSGDPQQNKPRNIRTRTRALCAVIALPVFAAHEHAYVAPGGSLHSADPGCSTQPTPRLNSSLTDRPTMAREPERSAAFAPWRVVRSLLPTPRHARLADTTVRGIPFATAGLAR